MRAFLCTLLQVITLILTRCASVRVRVIRVWVENRQTIDHGTSRSDIASLSAASRVLIRIRVCSPVSAAVTALQVLPCKNKQTA